MVDEEPTAGEKPAGQEGSGNAPAPPVGVNEAPQSKPGTAEHENIAQRQKRIADIAKHRRCERRKRSLKFWVECVGAMATVAIAFLTAAYVHYSGKQWSTLNATLGATNRLVVQAQRQARAALLSAKAAKDSATQMKKSVDLARETTEATQRARVILKDKLTKPDFASAPLGIHLRLKNIGHASAFFVIAEFHYRFRIQIHEGERWVDLEPKDAPRLEFLDQMEAKQEWDLHLPPSINHPEFLERYLLGKGELVIQGNVQYLDDFCRRITSICWIFGEGNSTDPRFGSEACARNNFASKCGESFAKFQEPTF